MCSKLEYAFHIYIYWFSTWCLTFQYFMGSLNILSITTKSQNSEWLLFYFSIIKIKLHKNNAWTVSGINMWWFSCSSTDLTWILQLPSAIQQIRTHARGIDVNKQWRDAMPGHCIQTLGRASLNYHEVQRHGASSADTSACVL